VAVPNGANLSPSLGDGRSWIAQAMLAPLKGWSMAPALQGNIAHYEENST